eukprot:5494133-Prymnesium_polylepis.1
MGASASADEPVADVDEAAEDQEMDTDDDLADGNDGADAAGGRITTASLVIFGMRPERLHPPPLAKNQERRRC